MGSLVDRGDLTKINCNFSDSHAALETVNNGKPEAKPDVEEISVQM